MRRKGKPRFRLGITRGSLDALKHRVVKRRARRHATHIDGMMKRMRGSHEWARSVVRMQKAFGDEELAGRYEP